MAGVSADIAFTLNAKLTGVDTGSASPSASSKVSRALQLLPGNAALGKADLLYTATRTLAASGTESLDLTGVLTGPLGNAFNAAEVVAIVVEAASANTNTVNVGGAGTNAFVGPFGTATDSVKVKPGQFASFVDTAGWTVTAATGDLLKVANGAAGTPVTYTITVVARSVAD